MADTPHIVVVDDEPDLRDTVAEYLGLHGFRVTAVDGAASFRSLVEEEPVDIAVLDINMPGEDGLSLARYAREHLDLGVIMLTAAADTVDRVVGLEAGADDYLGKPVDLRELLARLRALLRRLQRNDTATAPAAAPAANGTQVRFGRCILNLDSHRMHDETGAEVPLTAMEYDLLKAFAENPRRVLSREQLLQRAHNRSWDVFDRSIDIRIARLRRKLEDDPKKPQVLKTVRGGGYLYEPT